MDIDKISALAELISSSVAELSSLSKQQPFQSPGSSGKNININGTSRSVHDLESKWLKSSLCAISAAAQLISMVRPPEQVIMDTAMGYHLSSSLRLVIEAHAAEIIREKGLGPSTSLHVKAISAVNGVDPTKLGHILRLLATHYIFDEVAPDTFANNRLSAPLDTGKSLHDILASPLEKYDSDSGGFPALIVLTANESMRNAQFMTDALLDPKTTSSFSPLDAPFSRALWPGSEGLNMFEYFRSIPENIVRLRRFGHAMRGVSMLTPPDAILRGFDWSSLSENSTIIDVGGGVGAASLPIVQRTGVKLIIEETDAVVRECPKFWKANLPGTLESGRVQFIVHDFFEPQPPLPPPSSDGSGDTIVFLLRMIFHNWPDKEAIQILKHLRAAVSSGGAEDNRIFKLVIIDGLLTYACPHGSTQNLNDGKGNGIESSEVETLAPSPLLANWGAANGMAYKFDIQMLCNHNAGERTLAEFETLLEATGWRVVEVHQMQQSWLPQIVAVPASLEGERKRKRSGSDVEGFVKRQSEGVKVVVSVSQ